MTDPHHIPDNHVTIFQLDQTSIRGRAVRLGSEIDAALKSPDGRDRYPEHVAHLLGEAMMIGAIVVQALKFKGRLVVQCHGTNKGAISLLTADCTTEGNIRAYARWDEARLKMLCVDRRQPGADILLGGGTFSMTIDQGPDKDQYQGLSSIEGQQLSDCAEHYFRQSEQIPTRIQLSCGQLHKPGAKPVWRGGGIMIQPIAENDTEGHTGANTQNPWTTAKTLFKTVTHSELIDPDLSQNELLYRLFHENGVRIIDTAPIRAHCACSEDRLRTTLAAFEAKARSDMAKDYIITANCEFCATDYHFDIRNF